LHLRNHITVLLLLFVSLIGIGQTYQIDLWLYPDTGEIAEVVFRCSENERFEAVYSIPFQSQITERKLFLTDFIDDFKAYDEEGNLLSFAINKNDDIVIQQAKKLDYLSYSIVKSLQSGIVADKDNQSILLYPQFFIGYLNGMLSRDYEVTIHHKAGIFTSNPNIVKVNDTTDVIKAVNYAALSSQPIFYGKLDTLSFGKNKQVHLSVLGEMGKRTAKNLTTLIEPLVNDFIKELDTLSLKDYHFFFYFINPKKDKNVQYGGLFHSQTALFILPETGQFSKKHNSQIKKLVAHELMHTLSPHHLHSQLLSNLQYTLEQSQHLWLYEGVTEYLSLKFLVNHRHITEQEFWDEMAKKAVFAQRFPKYSMTEISKKITTPKYRSFYLNFYNRGALTALMLDLRICYNTYGQNTLFKVTKGLAADYGEQKAFEEELFIDEFITKGSSDWRGIFGKYIIGKKTLKLNPYLEKIGMAFYPTYEEDRATYGSFKIKGQGKEIVYFTNVKDNVWGIQNNDRLLEINGEAIASVPKFKLLFEPEPNELLQLTIVRNGKTLYLQGKAQTYKRKVTNVIKPLPLPLQSQKKLYPLFFNQ